MTSNKDNTSPRPWRVAEPRASYSEILDARSMHVLTIHNETTPRHDANLIVRAVNAHDDLVAALVGLLKQYEQTGDHSHGPINYGGYDCHACKARDALKKAGAL